MCEKRADRIQRENDAISHARSSDGDAPREVSGEELFQVANSMIKVVK